MTLYGGRLSRIEIREESGADAARTHVKTTSLNAQDSVGVVAGFFLILSSHRTLSPASPPRSPSGPATDTSATRATKRRRNDQWPMANCRLSSMVALRALIS